MYSYATRRFVVDDAVDDVDDHVVLYVLVLCVD